MLIEILICGALAILAGAMADLEENRGMALKSAVFVLIAVVFCVLALWAGFHWALQFKGAV